MKSIEFMYWLQGYFEVWKPEVLTEKQVTKVKNHLAMVEITEGRDQLPFCHWLNGALAVTPSGDINKENLVVIKKRLNDIFAHVVLKNLYSDGDESGVTKKNTTDKPSSSMRC